MDVRPYNPLRTFQFRVKFMTPRTPASGSSSSTTPTADPAAYVAGVRAVSGLTWSISSYETWSGGNNMHPYVTPNRTSWEPITLEHGIARDNTLELWAEAARAMAETPSSVVHNARRQLQIDVWDHAVLSGNPQNADKDKFLYSYLVHNAWVSKYVALPRLDAMTSEIALASVEITHEGWRREPPPAA